MPGYAFRPMDPSKPRMLTWRSGGWVLLLSTLLVSVALVWQGRLLLRSGGAQPRGDGRNPATYGFDLSRTNVPRDMIVASGVPVDGIPALTGPATMTPEEVEALNAAERGKYLVGGDRVVGVVIAGEARAYPLRVLAWHEVILDTLGRRPIAVTYNPLCDSVVVFDRRVGGEVLDFGVSGLLLDSNLLLFDRRPSPRDESLWSQLLGRAVAGPASAKETALRTFPASLARWDVWKSRHPGTTVVRPDPEARAKYKREPYGSYFGSDKLRFPVRARPPDLGLPLKTRVLVVEDSGNRWIHPLEHVAVPAEVRRFEAGGLRVEIPEGEPPASVLIDASDGATARVTYAFWFAWYAHHPDDPGTWSLGGQTLLALQHLQADSGSPLHRALRAASHGDRCYACTPRRR
jgi:hypothetical protein